MNLRRPQREALERLHELMLSMPKDLAHMERSETLQVMSTARPTWSFGAEFPAMTFALATGVGKTRLMGALAAYLFLAEEANTFLLLAPRAAVLRKLLDESRPSSSKYLFVDPALVREPRLWHSGNLESFDPAPATRDMFFGGPTLVILSPQSLVGDDKRATKASEHTGASVLDYLRTRPDLVVLMDEAHHLGGIGQREARAWTTAVRDTKPRLQFDFTATPRNETGVNILYSYDLRTCLKEKLYTKDVRVIVKQRDESVSDDDWDHHTLDFALDRLRRKEAALASRPPEVAFPPIKPVLLICAESTAHADQVGHWLQTKRSIKPAEILVTHSDRAKTEDDIARLVGIERPDNQVRIIINVYELTEGWDVTNVYVIAPLRKMGTFQGAIQTMGRGLRLPAGRRVEDEELDSLDLLCFGKDSLEDVLESALKEYGDEEDAEAYLQVKNSDDKDLHRIERTKRIPVSAVCDARLRVPRASRRPVEPDLDFDVATLKRIADAGATEFNLARGGVSVAAEPIRYDYAVFVRIATSRVLATLRYLSEPLHRDAVSKLVAGLIERLGQRPGQQVTLDWVELSRVVAQQIDRPYRKRAIEFDAVDVQEEIHFGDYEWWVPESYKKPLPLAQGWTDDCFRIPHAGWQRCVHEAVPFDVAAELELARILDRDSAINWWVRNDPARLRIATPIGNYEPDFVFLRRIDRNPQAVLVEAKHGGLWKPPESDARVKARAAEAWCRAVNSIGGTYDWQYWLLLNDDIEDASSVADLECVKVRVELPSGDSE
jgi:superfamily II DNA or RNA helicase